LNAVQAKDRDRLAEATALRASDEATTQKNKDLFSKISDLSISDAELDELSKKMEGYRLAGEDVVKSTGRLKFYADKSTGDGGIMRVTLTVRREKKGWGVTDLGSPLEFKAQGTVRRKGMGGRG
jgi:hypothetical protein